MLAKNTHDKYRNDNKFNKILDLEKQGFFLRARNIRDKYRKNCKDNKFNKILDLDKEETKKGPEMSANIAKIAKVTRIFPAS